MLNFNKLLYIITGLIIIILLFIFVKPYIIPFTINNNHDTKITTLPKMVTNKISLKLLI